MTNYPQRPTESPKSLAEKYLNEHYPSVTSVHNGVCKFAAIELSA